MGMALLIENKRKGKSRKAKSGKKKVSNYNKNQIRPKVFLSFTNKYFLFIVKIDTFVLLFPSTCCCKFIHFSKEIEKEKNDAKTSNFDILRSEKVICIKITFQTSFSEKIE